MQILKNIALVLLVLVCTNNAIAAEHGQLSTPLKKDYYADFYENEGTLLFKIRGFYAITGAKSSNLPTPTNAGAPKPGRVAENGYGLDTAMTIFATDNIAAEISLGFGFYKTKSSALNAALNAYGASDKSSVRGRNQIFIVPVTISAQYHLAPFGGIRPYIGVGYNGTYMQTRSKAIRVNSTSGPVAQVGIDFMARDNTLFTLDVKQYFLRSKLTYRGGFLGTNPSLIKPNAIGDLNSKINWSPVVISAGIGFKF